VRQDLPARGASSTPIGASSAPEPALDARSEASLARVHPDLCKIIRRAARLLVAPEGLLVIHGLRTQAEEDALVAKGASQTRHSRHLAGRDGFACAVDVAALAGGHVSWEPTHYWAIATAAKAAAHQLGIPLEWGGDWKTLKDLGHFQLPWADYP
jgi:peptidoglycan L-alanyl-D-glutamate endopeptidase CwlK